MQMQTASAIIFWEYERQRGKDLAKAAKEKAFQEANDEDKRVKSDVFSQHSSHCAKQVTAARHAVNARVCTLR